eukprot:7462080-Alexandrium_andersonii.AAC.1
MPVSSPSPRTECSTRAGSQMSPPRHRCPHCRLSSTMSEAWVSSCMVLGAMPASSLSPRAVSSTSAEFRVSFCTVVCTMPASSPSPRT